MTLSFWLILSAVLSWGFLHSILASIKIKTLVQQWFGSKTDRWYRLVYNIIAVITLLPVLYLSILLDDKLLYRIRYPWVILALIGEAFALIAVIIGIKQTGTASFIGLHQLFLPEQRPPPNFVTGGLYRYVRHPQYTGGLVFIWLFPIMTCNVLALNIGLTIYIIIGAIFDERKLVQEFGEAYIQYCHHTPMLIPGLKLPTRK